MFYIIVSIERGSNEIEKTLRAWPTTNITDRYERASWCYFGTPEKTFCPVIKTKKHAETKFREILDNVKSITFTSFAIADLALMLSIVSKTQYMLIKMMALNFLLRIRAYWALNPS